MNQTISFSTHSKFEIINLTSQVEEVVKKSHLNEGLCTVFAPHATAAVIINEDEVNLKEDIIFQVKTLFSSDNYKHDRVDDNAQAHLAASFLGQSINIPFVEKRLIRGTWQEILFIELDGPRSNRQIVVLVKN